MAGRLQQKVALVTASSEGIGYAIAERLATDGATVIISSRNAGKIERAVKSLQRQHLNVHGSVCHVGKEEDRQALITDTVKQYGGIDILVSNAAVSPHFGPFLECSSESWDKIFDINVKSAFELTKLVVPYMKKRGGGSIIYISSYAAYQPVSVIAAYSISKTALLGLTKAVADEVSSDNIRVNCIAPGVITTKFSAPLYSDPGVKEHVLEQIPMKRLGKPSEIAGLASFLCSDDASYITGEAIVVGGGMSARL